MSIEKNKDNIIEIKKFIEEKLTAEETIQILHSVLNNIENDLMEHAVDAEDHFINGFKKEGRKEQNAADKFDKAHGYLEQASIYLEEAVKYKKKIR